MYLCHLLPFLPLPLGFKNHLQRLISIQKHNSVVLASRPEDGAYSHFNWRQLHKFHVAVWRGVRRRGGGRGRGERARGGEGGRGGRPSTRPSERTRLRGALPSRVTPHLTCHRLLNYFWESDIVYSFILWTSVADGDYRYGVKIVSALILLVSTFWLVGTLKDTVYLFLDALYSWVDDLNKKLAII